MKLTGGCGCGGVRFTVDGEPRWQGYCHCRSCQIAHAAPMFAGAIFSAKDFAHTGEVERVTVTESEDATARYVCTRCGTKVFNAPVASVRTICLTLCERRDWFAPQAHMWWSERVVNVADELPKFLDMPTAFGGTGELA